MSDKASAAQREIHPILSFGSLEAADADALQYHRRWCLLDDKGQPITTLGSAASKVTLMLSFGFLVLRAPGMLRLDVPLDVIEDDPTVIETVALDGNKAEIVDEGPWAAKWFSEVLGRPVRLVKIL